MTHVPLCLQVRLVMTLRPLRIVQRIPSVMRTVQVLYMSIRPISNVVLLGFIFYIIFAIWGVQMFKGKFYYCDVAFVEPVGERLCLEIGASYNARNGTCTEQRFAVQNDVDCALVGGQWTNREYNFDNLFEAIMTLFVVSSKDGWVEIMYHGVDAPGVGQQPVRDHSWEAVLYFVSFLCIVGYFVISMFVGVIVENFQLSMSDDEETSEDGSSIVYGGGEDETESLEDSSSQCITLERPRGAYRGWCYDIIEHRWFDTVMISITVVSIIAIACEHHNEPASMDYTLMLLNAMFTVVFLAEAILKISGLSWHCYWNDTWNRIEFVIVIGSVAGSIVEFIGTPLHINPALVRVVSVYPSPCIGKHA